MSFISTKTFEDFPCSHRQWKHQGHCKFVHGYSRSFKFWFKAHSLDKNSFVVDFSEFKDLRERLIYQFDHTFLINKDDPLMPEWEKLYSLGAIDLRVMDNVGMEATSKLCWEWANEILKVKHDGRTCCYQVEARENKKNSALYCHTPNWFN